MTRQLLFSVTRKDLVVQHFRAGGKGGQHQNVTDSGTRIVHAPSGARGESREHRSQHQNTRAALKRLANHPSFLWWVHQETLRVTGKQSAEERTAEAMHPKNLKLEVSRDGVWVATTADELTDAETHNLAATWLADKDFRIEHGDDTITVSTDR